LVKRADEYPWSSYPAHGLGQSDELLDRVLVYEELSPYPAVRQRKWAEKIHTPPAGATLAEIRRSTTTGLPYGSPKWVERLAKKLDLDLTIRPRGRPSKQPPPAE
jgi:putative transposase